MRTLFLSAFLVLGSLLSTSCGDDEEDTSAVTLTSQITGSKFKINSVELNSKFLQKKLVQLDFFDLHLQILFTFIIGLSRC